MESAVDDWDPNDAALHALNLRLELVLSVWRQPSGAPFTIRSACAAPESNSSARPP